MHDDRDHGSLWSSRRDARVEGLEVLTSSPLAAGALNKISESSDAEIERRAEAYRTPVTAETLRRSHA